MVEMAIAQLLAELPPHEQAKGKKFHRCFVRAAQQKPKSFGAVWWLPMIGAARIIAANSGIQRARRRRQFAPSLVRITAVRLQNSFASSYTSKGAYQWQYV